MLFAVHNFRVARDLGGTDRRGIAALFRDAKLKNRSYVKCLTNKPSPLAIENGHGQQLPVEDG